MIKVISEDCICLIYIGVYNGRNAEKQGKKAKYFILNSTKYIDRSNFYL